MDKEALQNPRVIVIQKLYAYHLNIDIENLSKMLLLEQLKEGN